MKQRPYWWDTVDDGSAGRLAGCRFGPADADRVWDVLVIGAGYSGLSAARRLALQGASVLVVDREAIGWGASSRNGGQVLAGLKLDPASLVARYGERQARELFTAANAAITTLESLIDEEGIACGYSRCGHVQAAAKPSHFAAFRSEQQLLARTFGHIVHLVPPSDQRREIGSDRYHGLLIDERSASLNPAQYADGLAAAAARAGARIRTGAAVLRVARSGERWRAATDADVDIIASHVLVAANGYTDAAAPAIRRRFVPVGSYVIATEPLEPARACALLPRRRVAFDSKHVLFYFRVTDDRRLLFGGRAEFRQPGESSVPRAAAILRRGMVAVFPELEGVRIDYAWGGCVAFTRDQMPHAGVADGMFFVGGYCGHGVAMATLLGDLIARQIGGERVDNPLFALECPPVPLYNGRPWFLPLAGAYYKVKDWLS